MMDRFWAVVVVADPELGKSHMAPRLMSSTAYPSILQECQRTLKGRHHLNVYSMVSVQFYYTEQIVHIQWFLVFSSLSSECWV
jgi:hypothetical protein